MQQFVVLIIPILLLWAWILPVGFSKSRTEGTVIQVRAIPLLARIKRHSPTHGLVMVATIALMAAGLASAWWLLVIVASFVAIIAVPQRYVVTTRGICTGRGNFRRWTEFAGVYRSRAGARLQTISRRPDVPIWLSGDIGDDEFVHLLRTLVRDSYKGKLTTVPPQQVTERQPPDRAGFNGVAAYKHHR